MAGGRRQRPVLTPPGDAGEDQPRVDRRAVVGPDAEALTGAGPETVQQHVGLRRQVEQSVRLVLNVEVDHPLAAVHEVDVLGGHRQSARASHSDHVRTQIGQNHAGVRARAYPAEFDHSPRPGVRYSSRLKGSSATLLGLQNLLAQPVGRGLHQTFGAALDHEAGQRNQGSTVSSNRTRVESPSGSVCIDLLVRVAVWSWPGSS